MKLYTVVITHYNQMKYIYEAIDSVLMQDYPNIELIITDDNSKKFREKEILKYIEKHKNQNIKNYFIIRNDLNVGTVKTLNRAIKQSSGDYIQFFAADDALYNKRVISKFVKELDSSKELIITTQCYMCGKSLEDKKEKYVFSEYAKSLNTKSAYEQYLAISDSCMYGSGATAYNKKIFSELGLFYERYKLVEDWSFYLIATLNGYKIKYVDFVSFLHRTGGVSHYEKNDLPPHVRFYQMDILNIFEDLVLINLHKKNKYTAEHLFNKYVSFIDCFGQKDLDLLKTKCSRIRKVRKNNKLFFIQDDINKIKNILHSQLIHTVLYILIFMFMVDVIVSLIFKLDYKYIFVHFFSYIVALIIIKILKIIKRRLRL